MLIGARGATLRLHIDPARSAGRGFDPDRIRAETITIAAAA